MFSAIFKDIWSRFSDVIVKVIVVVIAVVALGVYLKSCSPFSTSSRQERVIEKQKEQITDLVQNNHTETSGAQTDREARDEAKDRLVDHVTQQAKDEKAFEEIITKVDKEYIPPPAKRVVVVKKKPAAKAGTVTAPGKPTAETPHESNSQEEITAEAKRSQHNLLVLSSAIEQAYEKAAQMSGQTP